MVDNPLGILIDFANQSIPFPPSHAFSILIMESLFSFGGVQTEVPIKC